MAPIHAKRKNGFCHGSLWKQHTTVTNSSNQVDGSDAVTAALYGNARGRTHDYCVLMGNTLASYTDVFAYRKGEHPTSEVTIVGASAWMPKPKNSKKFNGKSNPTSNSMLSSLGSASLSSESLTSTASESSPATGSPTFRIITNAGTHIYCIAPSPGDRDVWLTALHSALEASYASTQEVFSSICSSDSLYSQTDNVHKTLLPAGNNNNKLTQDQNILKPPVPQKRNPLSFRRRFNQSLSFSSNHTGNGAANQFHNTFIDPYGDPNSGIPSKTYCVSCGRYPPENIMPTSSTTPLPQYGIETRVNVCRPCIISQGLLRNVAQMTKVYAMDAHERAALTQARDLALKTIKEAKTKQGEIENNLTIGCSSASVNDDSNELPVQPSDVPNPEFDATNSLVELIQSDIFASFRRRSRVLDIQCRLFQRGKIGCIAEFLESLNEHAREATASSTALSSGEEIGMKKEALKISGDMGTAIKTLRDAALPHKQTRNYAETDTNSTTTDNDKDENNVLCGLGTSLHSNANCTEMIVCVLEFFLDLCEEGQLGSIAFFWPQLRQIHLQMLPPTDAGSLVRVELVEDFLLTVSVRYSVHLALELLWGCSADLEESFSSNLPSAACRRRRFAVLRFVCELESLLFDFDGGWGGGSVSLGGLLSPTTDQASITKEYMAALQMHRRFSSHHLSRSVRLEKMQSEAEKETQELNSTPKKDKVKNLEGIEDAEKGSTMTKDCDSPGTLPWLMQKRSPPSDMIAAERKYMIARNADYFSTQIMLTRRLGDIAEKLRFLDVDKRVAALENELEVLNSSGRMGGDPLNLICKPDEGLVSALHIPSKEGHVFRSKERTPILLLMEVLREKNPFPTPNIQEEVKDSNEITGRVSSEEVDIPDESNTTVVSAVDKDQTIFSGDPIDNPPLNDSENNGLNLEQITKMNGGADLRDSAEDDNEPSSLVENILITSENDETSTNDTDDNKNVTKGKENLSHHQKSSCVLSSPKKKEIGTEGPNKKAVEGLVASMINKKLTVPDLMSESISQNKRHNEENDIENDDSSTEIIKDPSRESEVDERSNNKQENIDLTYKKGKSDLTVVSTMASHQSKISTTISSGFQGVLKNSAMSVGLASLSANGEGRRQVLTTIMMEGMRSSNIIARGAAPVAQRAIQDIAYRKAQIMMNKAVEKKQTVEEDFGNVEAGLDINDIDYFLSNSDETTPESEQCAGDQNISKDIIMAPPSEEDECMESLRLLLIQHSVAQGNISPEKAAQVLAPESNGIELNDLNEKMNIKNDEKAFDETVDAGEIDPRLAGCGSVSFAVLSSLRLWRQGIVSNHELLELVQKDIQYTRIALPGAENENRLIEDSVFWGRFAFGERWAEKKARIQASSQHGSQPGWDLVGVIVKSNDDLRQEAFIMQLIELCREAFEIADLELWVQPYTILATGRTTGIIEMVRNAMSFDSLKKRPGYNSGKLLGHLKRMAEVAADPEEALLSSQKNFVRSLAAYSLMSYLFLFKDRHNGNLLLSTAGHVIHIDFGFVFGSAPGGSFSLEQSAPFKITEEMLEVMGGLGSSLFTEFVTLFCCGLLALQAHAETFCTLVEITCDGSTFNCFDGKDPKDIVSKLRNRLNPELDEEATIAYAMDLIYQATTSYGTKQYDYFQYLSNGIAQ